MTSKMNTPNPKFPWLYLVLAYGLAWLCWIPVAWTGQDYQSSPLLLSLFLLGVFGPGIAGIVLTYRDQGRAGGQDFWQRVFDWRRIRPEWYVLILLLVPALYLLAIAANNLLGGSPPTFEFVRRIAAQPLAIPVVVILYVIQASLEELGWRGYMLDRVQAIWQPLGASVVLGICHAFWHLPLFWVAGTNQIKWGLGPDMWLFVVFVIASSIYSTWFYNDNRRSTLAVILFHTVGNLSLDTFMLPGTQQRIFNLLFVLGAVFVATYWTMRKRARQVAGQEARAHNT
jgi:membrane protease YdiL (CAAX protease family)